MASEVLLQPLPAIANVAGVHRVPPTDFGHRYARRLRDALPVVRTGGPSALGDRSHALDCEPGPLCDLIDREARDFEQVLDGLHALQSAVELALRQARFSDAS